MKDRLTRVGLMAAIIASTNMAAACGNNVDFKPSYTPVATSSSDPFSNPERNSWSQLSPSERVRRLETKQYPEFSNFNVMNELVRATAEFYKEFTSCDKTVEELQKGIVFADSSTIIEIYGRFKPVNDKQKKAIENSRSIILDYKTIFINSDVFKKEVKEGSGVFSGQEVKNKKGEVFDPEIVKAKQTLYRAYSYLNVSSEDIQFNPSHEVPVVPRIFIDRINRFNVSGRTTTEETFSNPGLINAFTEVVAEIVSDQPGEARLHTSRELKTLEASLLTAELLSKANINDQEFLEYYFGKKSLEELGRKWASLKDPDNPDIRDGLSVIGIIELCADGYLSLNDAKKSINYLLNLREPIT